MLIYSSTYFKIHGHPFIQLDSDVLLKVQVVWMWHIGRILQTASRPIMRCWAVTLFPGEGRSTQMNAASLTIAVNVGVTFVLILTPVTPIPLKNRV